MPPWKRQAVPRTFRALNQSDLSNIQYAPPPKVRKVAPADGLTTWYNNRAKGKRWHSMIIIAIIIMIDMVIVIVIIIMIDIVIVIIQVVVDTNIFSC